MFIVLSTRLRGALPPHHDSASTSSPCHGSASCRPPSSRRGFPQVILSILFVFSRLVALFFFLSGWVGFPLPRFPPSPLFRWRFLPLGGWGPLAASSRRFPRVSWVFWGSFLGFRVFFCYLLHLASFSSRPKLGKDGLPTRKPPGPPRPFPWCVCSDPSPAGSRRADAPR